MKRLAKSYKSLLKKQRQLFEQTCRLLCREPDAIPCKLDHEQARVPVRASDASAGFDLVSLPETETGTTLVPNELVRLRTGLRMEIPDGLFGRVTGRSGLTSKKVVVWPGVIDSDYRGEVIIMATNLGDDNYTIKPGERVAQLLILPCLETRFEPTDKELSATQRDTGGFGSTGK